MSSFTCDRDYDVESFLKEKAILFEKTSKGRTFLIVNEDKLNDGKFEVFGYFTLALKVLKISEGISKSLVKKLDGLFKNIQETPVYLIGQLGKNDEHKEHISGKDLIDYALSIIYQSYEFIGGRIILVECNNTANILKFYNDNGFIYLQESELIQMVKFIQ